MSRPGVMLYFSILPALDSLSPASAGTLLLAAMHYAQDGREPVFEDGTLAFAWSFLKPSIDRDGEVYDEKRLRGEWLTYCRQCKRDNTEPLGFETWRQRIVTESLRTDTDTQPISVSIPDSLSVSDSMSVSVSNKSIGAGKPPTSAQRKYGEYGWVRLTDDEYSRLLSDLGQAELDRCIGYIDESAQSTRNKNRWKDWNLVLRRCHREGWGSRFTEQPPPSKPKRYRTEIIDGVETAVEVTDDV